MFEIIEANSDIQCSTLQHSVNVFHEALKKGGEYYHVTGDNGITYDISYKDNTECFAEILPSYMDRFMPEYREYDENDPETMDLEYLNSNSGYIMLKLTEYSIAVARAVLKYTDKDVYFMTEKILWFLDEDERLHINEMPEEDDDTVFLVGPMGAGYAKDTLDINKKSDILVFHSLFLMQYMLGNRRPSQIKYMQYPLAHDIVGIGGLLIQTAWAKEFAACWGWELAYNADTVGKYKISLLNQYFKFDLKKPDCTEDNTARMEVAPYMMLSWRYSNLPGRFTTDILQEKFHHELEEYRDAVIGNRSALGVLIRGTDYKKVGFKGVRRQATVSDMIPLIREWMDDESYEMIFLATEDKDVLDEMRRAFSGKMIAVAQERHSASELEKGQILNDFEKNLYSEEEYEEHIMDTTINYFYALYLLSRCDAFICSGQNNGWDTVNVMNGGKFERVYRFETEKNE